MVLLQNIIPEVYSPNSFSKSHYFLQLNMENEMYPSVLQIISVASPKESGIIDMICFVLITSRG
jgi:hypothetical protein